MTTITIVLYKYIIKIDIFQYYWNFSLARWNFSPTMKLISLTMKLFFWEKFHCDLKRWKTGRFKSLCFDFCVFNFDTMKLIFCVKTAEPLIPQWFWGIEKERKLQYQWYHNFRSYMVRATGLEPARKSIGT